MEHSPQIREMVSALSCLSFHTFQRSVILTLEGLKREDLRSEAGIDHIVKTHFGRGGDSVILGLIRHKYKHPFL